MELLFGLNYLNGMIRAAESIQTNQYFNFYD